MSNIKPLKKIQFTLFNPDEIEKYAVCQISHTDLYDNDGEPKFHGLFDTRMGVIDPNLLCSTCQKDIKDCPGHPGKILLHKKVYLPQFLAVVVKILQAVCFQCSSLLIEELQVSKKKNSVKFKTIHGQCKDIQCCHDCGCVQPKFSKNNLHIFIGKKNDNNIMEKMILDSEECYRILSNITNQDCKILGLDPEYSRPEWMVVDVLHVVPPCVRPSVVHESNMRSEDDLTQKYLEIIKTNNALKEKLDTIETLKNEKNNKIQEFFHETKDMNKAEQKYQELVEKHSRVVEDARMSVQIQVTTLVNNKLPGVPEIQNRSHLPLKCLTQRLVTKGGRIRGNLMGKRVDFSARSVITPDPKIDIDEIGVPKSIAMNLTYPETVNQYNIDTCTQYIQNGPDHFPGALFIIKKNKFRISLSIVQRKLKEFDEKKELSGRELKIKENFQNRLKLEFGDIVERHMMDGDWVLFNRQPSLHRMSMLAHRVKVLEYDTFRLNPNVTACYNADFDGDEMNLHLPQSIQTMTELKELAAVHKQMVSPQANKPVIGFIQDNLLGLYLFCKDDNIMTREKVMWLLGHFNKSFKLSKQTYTGKEVLSLFLPKINYKRNEAEIHNGIFKMGQASKKMMGISAGGILHIMWNDCGPEITRQFMNNVQKLIDNWLMEYGFSVGISDSIPDPLTKQIIQKTILEAEKNVSDLIKKSEIKTFAIQKDEDVRSEFEQNVAFILNQARDVAGSSAKNSLYKTNCIKNMVDSGSKGSSINISQIMALVGQQSIQGGTAGSRVGNDFQDRSLPHFVKYDDSAKARGFIRNSYLTGLAPHEFFFHMISGRSGMIDTSVKTSTTGYLQRKFIKSMEDVKIHYDQTVRNSSGHIVQFVYGGDNMDGCYIEPNGTFKAPFNIQRMILEYPKSKKTSLELIRDEIEKLFIKIDHCSCLLDAVRTDTLKPLKEFITKSLENVYLSERNFKNLVNTIYERYQRAMIQPSEMVGLIAGQSLGERNTQLTLNTFHSAGINSKLNVNQGVPRLEEIISVTKNTKAPSQKIYLHDGLDHSQYCAKLEHLTFDKLIVTYGIYYDTESPYSPWYTDIILNDYILFTKNIRMIDIYTRLAIYFEKYNFEIVVFPDNESTNVRIYCAEHRNDNFQSLKRLEEQYSFITISGIGYIQNAFYNEKENIIQTNGSNMAEVLALSFVDTYRTSTNDIYEIFDIFGIEAARQMIIQEINNIMEFNGITLDIRHTELLADVMTSRGFMMSIDRHGLKKNEGAQVLARASYEESVDMLSKAAIFNQEDNLNGITSNILIGQVAPSGTGDCELIME